MINSHVPQYENATLTPLVCRPTIGETLSDAPRASPSGRLFTRTTVRPTM
jgi:hypothetical protein